MRLRKFFTITLGLIGLSLATFGLTDQSKVVIGKLGQSSRQVGVHMRMSTASPVWCRVAPQEYLVIRTTKSKHWLGVILSNGREGYVPNDTVQKLPFVVTANRQPVTSPSRSYYGVAGYALNFIGTPYKWGGNDPYRGIDCSGFVKKMFGTIGVDLPRTAAEQALVGMPITRLEDLRAGDRLYFWEAKRHEIGHTGIYIGNGRFVHSSVSGHGVNVSYLTESWRKLLVAARR